MIKNKLILCCMISIASLTNANAHHGLDLYDTSQLVVLSGKVVDVELMDPHSVLVVEVVGDDGTVVIWDVEGGPARGIISAGLTKEYLRSGPTVRIEAFQTRAGRCDPRCRAAGENFEFDNI